MTAASASAAAAAAAAPEGGLLGRYAARLSAAAAARSADDGVPGTWLTGDRLLDVALLPLLAALGFVLLRGALRTLVFEPTGAAVMAARMKKSDKRWDARKRGEFMRKWCESCWKLVVYVTSTAAGAAICARAPWLTDTREFWTGATRLPLNYEVPLAHALYYYAQIGFYLQAVPFLMFIEVRRKDWAESFAHHLVTLGLLYYSFAVNFTRPGLAIAVLHDVSDIFLEAAKLSRYGGRQTAATAWFAAFAVSWIVCRVIVYPRTLVLSCLRDPIVIVALPYGIDPQPHYSIFATLLLVLYFLHLYWTWLILQVVWRQVRGQATKDVREDDDDSDSD